VKESSLEHLVKLFMERNQTKFCTLISSQCSLWVQEQTTNLNTGWLLEMTSQVVSNLSQQDAQISRYYLLVSWIDRKDLRSQILLQAIKAVISPKHFGKNSPNPTIKPSLCHCILICGLVKEFQLAPVIFNVLWDPGCQIFACKHKNGNSSLHLYKL